MSEKQLEAATTVEVKAETATTSTTVSSPEVTIGLTEEQRNYLASIAKTEPNLVAFLASKKFWRMHKGRPQFFCQHKTCQKWLYADASKEAEEGGYCAHLYNELGYTAESLKKLHDSKVAAKPDELKGKVKTADLHKMCAILGIPIARLVKAFGGDRQLNGPAEPHFKYVHGPRNARYVDRWCATLAGMQYLAGQNKGIRWQDAKAACATVIGKDVANELYGKEPPKKASKPEAPVTREDGKALAVPTPEA